MQKRWYVVGDVGFADEERLEMQRAVGLYVREAATTLRLTLTLK